MHHFRCFNLKNPTGRYKFRKKNYSFNYELDTDGFGVSLNLIHDSQISIKEKKKENFKKGRKETNEKKRTLPPDAFNEYIKEKIPYHDMNTHVYLRVPFAGKDYFTY